MIFWVDRIRGGGGGTQSIQSFTKEQENTNKKKETLYTLFINGGTRGRVWVEYMKARRKGLPIQMKTKQSMEMQVESLVILEISRQLGSDSCLLMTAVEIPGSTTTDMVLWFRGQHQKVGKCRRKTASIS